MASLYASVLRVAGPARLRECFAMLIERSARLLSLPDYGLAVGNPTDIFVIDAAISGAGPCRDPPASRGLQVRATDGGAHPPSSFGRGELPGLVLPIGLPTVSSPAMLRWHAKVNHEEQA